MKHLFQLSSTSHCMMPVSSLAGETISGACVYLTTWAAVLISNMQFGLAPASIISSMRTLQVVQLA